VVDFSEVVG